MTLDISIPISTTTETDKVVTQIEPASGDLFNNGGSILSDARHYMVRYRDQAYTAAGVTPDIWTTTANAVWVSTGELWLGDWESYFVVLYTLDIVENTVVFENVTAAFSAAAASPDNKIEGLKSGMYWFVSPTSGPTVTTYDPNT